jgi:hypothetical protein
MRDAQLLNIRPKLDLDTTLSSVEEQFQNNVLRPILKLQHPLLVAIFKHSIEKHHKTYQNLPKNERFLLIASFIKHDHKMRQSLAGTVMGHFTMEEYLIFQQNEAGLMRRLISLMVQRIQSADGELLVA